MINFFRSDISVRDIASIIGELSSMEVSAGIIENNTDDVIWRNVCSAQTMKEWRLRLGSSFDVPVNTRQLHNYLVLNHIKREVRKLTPIKNLLSSNYALITYSLIFPGGFSVEVQDKFYRFDTAGIIYRIWINVFWRSLLPIAKFPLPPLQVI